MIRSFKCRDTERLFNGHSVRRFRGIERAALNKLVILDAAPELGDLRKPPGNRLEALRGDRAGQHSIRINGRWRICFLWRNEAPEGVEIVDYH